MKKILVVDDSAFMRVSITKILTEHGYQVIGQAENGQMALEKYRELQPDVVTMDITMRDMDGLEALRQMKALYANVKVVMVSAMGQEPYVRAALAAGAQGFLIKPFDEKQVIATLERVLKKP